MKERMDCPKPPNHPQPPPITTLSGSDLPASWPVSHHSIVLEPISESQTRPPLSVQCNQDSEANARLAAMTQGSALPLRGQWKNPDISVASEFASSHHHPASDLARCAAVRRCAAIPASHVTPRSCALIMCVAPSPRMQLLH